MNKMAAPLDVDQLFIKGKVFPDYESFEAVWNTYCGSKYVFRKKQSRSIDSINNVLKNTNKYYPESWKYFNFRLNCIHWGRSSNGNSDSASDIDDNTDVDTDINDSKPQLRRSAYIKKTGCPAFIRLQGNKRKGGLMITGVNLEHSGHDNVIIAMPKKPVPYCPKRLRYSTENMKAAVEDVLEKRKGMRQAAKFYCVPCSTLAGRLKGVPPISKRRYLTAEEEEQLVGWIKESARRGIHRTMKHVRLAAQTISQKRGAVTKFENSVPGNSWLTLFLRRHPEIALQYKTELQSEEAAVGVDSSCSAIANQTEVGSSTSYAIHKKTETDSATQPSVVVTNSHGAIHKTETDSATESISEMTNSPEMIEIEIAPKAAETEDEAKVTVTGPSDLGVDPPPGNLPSPATPCCAPLPLSRPLQSASPTVPLTVNTTCVTSATMSSSQITSSPVSDTIPPSFSALVDNAPTKEILDRLLDLVITVGFEGLVRYRTHHFLGIEPVDPREKIFTLLYSRLVGSPPMCDNSEQATEGTFDTSLLSSHRVQIQKQTPQAPKTIRVDVDVLRRNLASMVEGVTDLDEDKEQEKRNKEGEGRIGIKVKERQRSETDAEKKRLKKDKKRLEGEKQKKRHKEEREKKTHEKVIVGKKRILERRQKKRQEDEV